MHIHIYMCIYVCICGNAYMYAFPHMCGIILVCVNLLLKHAWTGFQNTKKNISTKKKIIQLSFGGEG